MLYRSVMGSVNASRILGGTLHIAGLVYGALIKLLVGRRGGKARRRA